MLDADALTVEGMLGVGNVAGGEHAGHARLELLVDEDAVVQVEAGVRGELDPRLHANADDDEVAIDRAAVAGADTLDRFPPSNASTPVPISIRTTWSVWMSR
jgi:hypothetical protein